MKLYKQTNGQVNTSDFLGYSLSYIGGKKTSLMDSSTVDFCKNMGTSIDQFKCGVCNKRHIDFTIYGVHRRGHYKESKRISIKIT